MSIESLMAATSNYFMREKIHGEIVIEGGLIAGLIEGDYYLIDGSDYNDGVFVVGDLLHDETFTGYLVRLVPPRAFVALAEKVDSYKATNPDGLASESVGGYSRSFNNSATWRTQYADELGRYSKLPRTIGEMIAATPTKGD